MSGLLDTDDVNVRVARHRRSACLGYATQAKCMSGLLDLGEVNVRVTRHNQSREHRREVLHKRDVSPAYPRFSFISNRTQKCTRNTTHIE